MSFWNTSDNQAINATGSFESGGGDFEPIPNNTQARAVIGEARWDDYEGDYFINLTWELIDGEHKGRKVFQKVRVRDDDSKKRDKALRMLAAIDANSGGGLMRVPTEPTDQDLSINLCNKPMIIKIMVWSMERDGETKKGNWVSAVAPANAQLAPPQAPPAVNPSDDVPF